MKQFLVLIGLLLTVNAHAYTIERVGQFEAYQYNEFLNKHIAHKGEVWVGVTDEGKEKVIVKVDSGLKKLSINMTVGEGAFLFFTNAIDKAIEWAEVARTNSVDINKSFPKVSKFTTCTTWESICAVSFSSWSDGQKSTMYLSLEDKENQFYDFDGQIPFSDITLLKEIFDVQVPLGLASRHDALNNDPATDVDALFN